MSLHLKNIVLLYLEEYLFLYTNKLHYTLQMHNT